MFFNQQEDDPLAFGPYTVQLKHLVKQVRAGKARFDGGYYSGFDHVDPAEVDAYTTYAKLFKQLAFDVVFLSPELKQLEHKGSFLLRRLWQTLFTRYAEGEAIDGQYFSLLPHETAEEIGQAASRDERARLICDFLADQTDGSAARMFQRLFTPDFGSIGDLVG